MKIIVIIGIVLFSIIITIFKFTPCTKFHVQSDDQSQNMTEDSKYLFSLRENDDAPIIVSDNTLIAKFNHRYKKYEQPMDPENHYFNFLT